MFTDLEVAETVKANLFGLPRIMGMTLLVWEDDEDYPDLYVQPLEIR